MSLMVSDASMSETVQDEPLYNKELPASSTAMQKLDDVHETAYTAFGESITCIVQVPLVCSQTFPALSTAAQKVDVGHETLVRTKPPAVAG